MDLSDDQRHDLNVALNEATLIGVELDTQRRAAALTFAVLTLPPDDVSQRRGEPAHWAKELDLRIWFDELRVFTPEHEEIALDDFAAGGVRWWDGLYANDPRTAGHGIAPLAGNGRTG